MRPGPVCSMPGCRTLAEPRPRALCKEHRGGGERGAPRPARERTDAGRGSLPRNPRRSGPRLEELVRARAIELEVCAGFLEFNVNRLSVAECAAFIRKKARETREEMQPTEGGKA
jgi:hypothetical protein